MIQSTFRPSMIAVAGMVAVGMPIGVSSLGIVRAEHVTPDKTNIYRCSSGTACVEGSSTGSSAWGVYGTGTTADGVRGITSTANGNSGRSGRSIRPLLP
ncbi:MAG: hypothetical protein WB526_03990 [Candidatus Cybelea sp.]